MTKFTKRESQQLKRFEINIWEGLNTVVGDNLAKRGEASFLENVRSKKVGWLEKRDGSSLIGDDISATNNFGLYNFSIDSNNLIRISKVSNTTSIYKLNEGNNTWTQLPGKGTGLSEFEADFTTALGKCFIVNGIDNNRYIESDTVTVKDSDEVGSMIYNSPKARLINYYRDRLFVGDYERGDGTKERTGIAFSSTPLGIVSLVNGDHDAPITTLEVTDTKYIKVGSDNDTLDVYRGGALIGTITVTARTENTLTISSFGTDLKSNDELWVANTKNGEKVFRWDNQAAGIAVREYDTFKNSSEEDLVLLTNVGNNEMIFTKNSITAFNGAAVRPLDLNIGCVSKKTFVKILGQGLFLHYTGIYSTSGDVPRLLSAKIQQVFDNADPKTMNNACAAADNFSYFVHIGNVTFENPDGSTKKILNNVVVEYNLRQNNFYIHTDVPMSHFVSFTKDDSTRILVFTKAKDLVSDLFDRVQITENITISIT